MKRLTILPAAMVRNLCLHQATVYAQQNDAI